MRGVLYAGLTAAGLSLAAPAALAAGGALAPEKHHWSFDGLFGTFDRAALQRGFQVYKQVCSACHSLSLLYYRNLEEIGLSEDQVKAIAAEVEVQDGPNDEGEMFDRPGRPSDRFPKPFANDQAARAANGGAMPPDLSLIVKARKDGANYLHSLMTGYAEAPPPEKNACATHVEEMVDGKMQTVLHAPKISDTQYYNPYFAGCIIAMPAPLAEGAVEYADGTKSTVAQMAEDVTVFLAWAAEPEMEVRKRMGVKWILFLIVLTGLFYAVKRKVWAKLH